MLSQGQERMWLQYGQKQERLGEWVSLGGGSGWLAPRRRKACRVQPWTGSQESAFVSHLLCDPEQVSVSGLVFLLYTGEGKGSSMIWT